MASSEQYDAWEGLEGHILWSMFFFSVMKYRGELEEKMGHNPAQLSFMDVRFPWDPFGEKQQDKHQCVYIELTIAQELC